MQLLYVQDIKVTLKLWKGKGKGKGKARSDVIRDCYVFNHVVTITDKSSTKFPEQKSDVFCYLNI